jgi:dTDP-4-dehydrorhamnose reductase
MLLTILPPCKKYLLPELWFSWTTRVNILKEQGYEVIATGRGDKRIMADNIVYESIELTDQWHVKALLEKYSPDVIIHNAALSKPGECESNRDHCVM